MLDKIFMVLFVVIMTVGILGLPLFYFLNSRKKRVLEEYDKNIDPDTKSEEEN